MAAVPGCYSVTFISSKTVPTKPPKRIYRVSCFEKHHFEVFWAGKVSPSMGSPIPSPKRSLEHCLEQSKKFTSYSRSGNSYNFGPNETIGTGNWLSDKGPEAKRFPNRLVCYFALSNSDFRIFKEVDRPLVKGLE
jgi:hypothetical protein